MSDRKPEPRAEWTVKPCGCKSRPFSERTMEVRSCRTHYIMAEFAFFHEHMEDAHIDCCDVPQMADLIGEYGREAVLAAVEEAANAERFDGAYIRRVWEKAA